MMQLMTMVTAQLLANQAGGDLMDTLSYILSIVGGIVLAVLALKIASRLLRLVFGIAFLAVLVFLVLKIMGVL